MLPLHVPDFSAGEKTFRVVFVEQDEVERPVAVEFRQLEVDVGVDVLGEGVLLFSDSDFPELSGQVSFFALRAVFLGAADAVLVHRVVEKLKKIART